MGITAGLIEPTSGTVHVVGHPAGSLEARGALAYAGDTPILYDDLSVWEHLEYVRGATWRRRLGITESRAARIVRSLGPRR
jgi:ABC-type multidrug transport system ATPase subunit